MRQCGHRRSQDSANPQYDQHRIECHDKPIRTMDAVHECITGFFQRDQAVKIIRFDCHIRDLSCNRSADRSCFLYLHPITGIFRVGSEQAHLINL